jgi:hypothetical protein
MRRATCALVAAALALAPAPAFAAQDPTAGYWSRVHQVAAPLPVPPPDRVPEGGAWVAQDPAGPVAVSAVRAEADPGNVVAGLRLAVADVVATPAVLVCPTLDRWAPAQGGRLEAAPVADCTDAAEARVEQDVLVVDLPRALQAAVLDVLLVPAKDARFSLTLERPTAASVQQAPVRPPGPRPVPPPAAAPAAPTGTGDSGTAGLGSGSTFFDSGALVDVADAPAAEPLVPAPDLPESVAPAVPQPQAAPTLPLAVDTRRSTVAAADDRTLALLSAVLLAMLGALALRLAMQPATPPRHLGGGARLARSGAAPAAVMDSPARGVGRFRAPRARPPVRL